MDYLLELRDKVDTYKLQGKTSFTEKKYEEAKAEYLRLLSKWDDEYKANYDKDKDKDKDKNQYYKSERCLKARLREYVDYHLRFLTDFRIDFTNNLAERELRKRIKKNKNKIKNSRRI